MAIAVYLHILPSVSMQGHLSESFQLPIVDNRYALFCFFHAFLLKQWGFCASNIACGCFFPKAWSGFYQWYWWRRGSQKVGSREWCLWLGANWAGQAKIVNPGLLWETGSLITWAGYPAICSCCITIIKLFSQGRMEIWKGWDGHGRVGYSWVWRILPHSAKGCSGLCLLELQLPNEIKMPTPCLYEHLEHIDLSCLMSISQESKRGLGRRLADAFLIRILNVAPFESQKLSKARL